MMIHIIYFRDRVEKQELVFNEIWRIKTERHGGEKITERPWGLKIYKFSEYVDSLRRNSVSKAIYIDDAVEV